MKNFSGTEKKTRSIYHKQHQAYLQDRSIFNRFYRSAVDPSCYGVDEAFFKSITVLDAGCGNTGYFQKAMYDLGAKRCVCIDIGYEWISELKNFGVAEGIPDSFLEFHSASVNDLPFPDDSFDFVASNGVLMHLESIERACLAFSEMCRIVKKGGALYAYIGYEAGVIEKYIVPAFRRAYAEDNSFKSLIDNLNEKNLAKIVDRYITFATENDDSLEVLKLQPFMDLITLDTIKFIQNVLQVPVQNGAFLTSSWGCEQYKRNNFITTVVSLEVNFPEN